MAMLQISIANVMWGQPAAENTVLNPWMIKW